MKICLIIPTFNRTELLPLVLAHLEKQTRPPDNVILSAPDESHVVDYSPENYKISFVFGAKGLCAQRNRAMAQALDRADIVSFFDDDFLPANDYLQEVAAAFAEHPEWAVIFGRTIADGAKGPGLCFQEGLDLLENYEPGSPRDLESVAEPAGAYGCNMSFRAIHIHDLRFDERLALYGWQEDIDFSRQLRPYGDIVAIGKLIGVHLGVKSGRVSGVRFGYSQISNPAYLVLKGTMPPVSALTIMSRNVLANTAKSLRPEPYVDRRGRLRGNLIALLHLFRGRVEPEYILKL